jgi:translation initiation factor 1
MAKQKNDWKKREGMVYSTNPDFEYSNAEEDQEETPDKQDFRISLDKKARAGKKVTLITGFKGNELVLQMLAKELKTLCGVGGSAKEGEIILQGDFRDRVLNYLLSKGHRAKKAGG